MTDEAIEDETPTPGNVITENSDEGQSEALEEKENFIQKLAGFGDIGATFITIIVFVPFIIAFGMLMALLFSLPFDLPAEMENGLFLIICGVLGFCWFSFFTELTRVKPVTPVIPIPWIWLMPLAFLFGVFQFFASIFHIFFPPDLPYEVEFMLLSESEQTSYQDCKKDDFAACNSLGNALYRHKEYELSNKFYLKAVNLYDQGCSGDHAESCNRLGLMYAKGEGVEKNRETSATLYQQACDGGNVDGCSNLASRLANGDGVEKDIAKSKALYAKACEGGHESACDKK